MVTCGYFYGIGFCRRLWEGVVLRDLLIGWLVFVRVLLIELGDLVSELLVEMGQSCMLSSGNRVVFCACLG